MTDLTEREKQIVAWLRKGPFLWSRRKSTIRERILAALRILFRADKSMQNIFDLLALKIEAGEPWKDQE